MAGYYNPYTAPMNYGGVYGNNPYGQQSFAAQPQMMKPMEWVDGEAGALAFQMPQGWPVNQPIALWDSQSQTIYLKSWNQMGMSNKIQKLNYQIVEEPVGNLPGGQSGKAEYVTKEEFESLREEIRSLGRQNMRANQNGSNRGENNGKPAV